MRADKDGVECFGAEIIVDGTNTGKPFSPIPGLKPVNSCGKRVKVGPERYLMYTNEDGYISKMTIESLNTGPSGPFAFYAAIGGVLPEKPKQEQKRRSSAEIYNSTHFSHVSEDNPHVSHEAGTWHYASNPVGGDSGDNGQDPKGLWTSKVPKAEVTHDRH